MKSLILLSLLQLGAASGDAFYTHRNMQMPRRYEANPLARPFVGSTHGVVLYFSATSLAHIGGAYWLRKHKHDKLAHWALVAGTIDNASGAAFSAVHGLKGGTK